MCAICDGMSRDGFAAETAKRIRLNRYTMIGVKGPPAWVYTIGLIENFDHPELVVADWNMQGLPRILETFVDAIEDGERYDAPEVLRDPVGDMGDLRIIEVHEGQWVHGRFDSWFEHYQLHGPQPANPRAMQLVLPGHEECQPILDTDPGSNVHRLNRAGRRATTRRTRRR